MGPICMDGVVEGDEECDDGNDVWADTCRNDCKVPKCGDTYDHDNNPATAEIPLVSSTETCEVGTTTSCVSAGVTGGTGTVTCKTDCSAWNTVPTDCSALNDTTKALCACQKSWTCPTKPYWNNELDTDYNTVDTYTQYWVGAGAWDPANDTLTDYNKDPSSTSCRFLCGLNLEWDSGLGKCVGIEKTPDFNCASYLDTSVPAHAGKVINTPSTYTQTWTFDGGNWDWAPADDTDVDYSSTYVGPTNPCTYRCDTGY
ncbi:MAG TPA: DUF4215 domain-containing protein, partial [bacterium]|nr:DUF4215 domain-containing protein [bacterium]